MQICRNSSVSESHRNVQRMSLRNKDAKVENDYGGNPSNNDSLFRRNPVFACAFPHMFIIKNKTKKPHAQAVNSWLQK